MSAEEKWVEVQNYDPSWPQLYEIESKDIKQALGNYAIAIEHFGSTAGPEITAKPIIDILVGTQQSEVPQSVIESLEMLSYEYLGEDGRRPGRFFFRKRGNQAFNISIVPMDGHLWTDNLRVRDFLRSHPTWAQNYSAIKRQAAITSPDSMLGYQDGKRKFIEDMKRAASAWAEKLNH